MGPGLASSPCRVECGPPRLLPRPAWPWGPSVLPADSPHHATPHHAGGLVHVLTGQAEPVPGGGGAQCARKPAARGLATCGARGPPDAPSARLPWRGLAPASSHVPPTAPSSRPGLAAAAAPLRATLSTQVCALEWLSGPLVRGRQGPRACQPGRPLLLQPASRGSRRGVRRQPLPWSPWPCHTVLCGCRLLGPGWASVCLGTGSGSPLAPPVSGRGALSTSLQAMPPERPAGPPASPEYQRCRQAELGSRVLAGG